MMRLSLRQRMVTIGIGAISVLHAGRLGGGWWDDDGAIGCCVGAWQPKGAASYAASLLDLSGNGNDVIEGQA